MRMPSIVKGAQQTREIRARMMRSLFFDLTEARDFVCSIGDPPISLEIEEWAILHELWLEHKKTLPRT